MKQLIACWLGAACVHAIAFGSGQVKLTLQMPGWPPGSASFSQKVLPDGSKLVQLNLEMKDPAGRSVRVRSESSYDSKGSPIRKFLESIVDKPRDRRQVVVTFDEEGAHVVEEKGGKRTTKHLPLAKAAPRENPSEFWFLRDRPKPGAKAQYYRFDIDSMSWVLTTTTYVGPKTVAVGRSKLSGHLIQDDRAQVVLDDKGLPLRMEVGNAVFTRASE